MVTTVVPEEKGAVSLDITCAWEHTDDTFCRTVVVEPATRWRGVTISSESFVVGKFLTSTFLFHAVENY